MTIVIFLHHPYCDFANFTETHSSDRAVSLARILNLWVWETKLTKPTLPQSLAEKHHLANIRCFCWQKPPEPVKSAEQTALTLKIA